MSFRFSLQKILDVREGETKQAQKQLSSTEFQLLQLRKMLEQERLDYFSDREELNAAVQKFQFTEIKVYEKSLLIRQNKMMELLRNIREVQNELSLCESNLRQAKLNQKTIEKLYELKKKEYENIEKMKEQYTLDEMANVNYFKAHLEEENEE